MEHDRQKDDPVEDHDSTNSRAVPGRQGDRARNPSETDLERQQIEGNLGNERVKENRDDDRDAGM